MSMAGPRRHLPPLASRASSVHGHGVVGLERCCDVRVLVDSGQRGRGLSRQAFRASDRKRKPRKSNDVVCGIVW